VDKEKRRKIKTVDGIRFDFSDKELQDEMVDDVQ
jgi:hypothetical protein